MLLDTFFLNRFELRFEGNPLAMENVKRETGNVIRYANSAREALGGADCCFIVTEWDA